MAAITCFWSTTFGNSPRMTQTTGGYNGQGLVQHLPLSLSPWSLHMVRVDVLTAYQSQDSQTSPMAVQDSKREGAESAVSLKTRTRMV